MNYYSEFDPHAAAWLRELIAQNLIPPGDVDERDIRDVTANDVRGYTQCHFFAGIGGWSRALQLAGWPADRPVWTGSCPCQPYSSAGKQRGNADERNLWPDFFRLIRECRPDVCFGEQVESAIRHGWLDGIQADLEGEDYAVGHCVLGAHSVGAPHIRQRLYWMADGTGERRHRLESAHRKNRRNGTEAGGRTRGMALADGGIASDRRLQRGWKHGLQPESGGPGSGLGNSDDAGLEGRGLLDGGCPGERAARSSGHWDSYILIPCGDGKTRRLKPGLEPLVNGVPGRVGSLRGYGNAIVPQVAAAFIEAYCEAKGGRLT